MMSQNSEGDCTTKESLETPMRSASDTDRPKPSRCHSPIVAGLVPCRPEPTCSVWAAAKSNDCCSYCSEPPPKTATLQDSAAHLEDHR